MRQFLIQCKNLSLIALLFLLAPLTFVSSKVMAADTAAAKKPLVVFFTHSGNTGTIAEMIHKKVGGEIIEIKTVTPYPEEYQKCVDQAKAEQRANARPAIETKINPDDYDVIFLGFPNWWSSMPMPVWSFIEQNNLNGKTIAPFMTHGGGGLGHAIGDLKKLCPKSKILEALSIRGTQASSASAAVDKWLKDLGSAITVKAD